MDLFDGDGEKVDEMNRRIAEQFGFSECYPVCGQTYPRQLDSRILNVLSCIAQSCYRMAQDIRLTFLRGRKFLLPETVHDRHRSRAGSKARHEI